MGISVTVSHLIFAIVAAILASAAGAYIMHTTGLVQSQLVQSVEQVRTEMRRTVEIAYATIDNSTSPAHYVIYVKNTGDLPIYESEWGMIDVYVGPYRQATLYRYDPNAGPGSGTFNMTDADGDGVWEPGETVVIRAYPTSDPPIVPTYEAKIYIFRGLGDTMLFPPPPS